MPFAIWHMRFLVVQLVLLSALGLRASNERLVLGTPHSFAHVPGYAAHGSATCASRTLDQGKISNDIVSECRALCEAWNGCECFVVTASRCRLGMRSSRQTRKAPPTSVAYVRDPGYVDPDSECRGGDDTSVEGNCQMYLSCVDGRSHSLECPTGLAFDQQRQRCVWADGVAACREQGTETTPIPEVSCGKSKFFIAGENTPEMQAWIKIEMDAWWAHISRHPEIRLRPEGLAAINILRTSSIEMVMKNNGTTSRWAIFSRGDDGGFIMQAVALVETIQTSVNIMAIVSRRALLNDARVQGGAGKALLNGILNSLHRQFPEESITLLGTPGDEHVEDMYRSHGMVEYGREETGMPKLKIVYPAECIHFMTSKILCREMRKRDYMRIAWRLLPGSAYIKKTCAHIIPSALFRQHALKAIGL